MKGLIGLTCLIGLLLLAGCAPDPKRAAEGYAISVAAEQEAKNAEQKREFEAELHALEVENQRAAQAEWQSGMMRVFRTGATVLQGLVIVLGVMGAWGMWGTTKAYNRWVEVRANLIHLDAKTGTYPMLLTYIGNGRYTAMLPDNTVLELDSRNEPDRIKLRGLLDIQHTAVLANNARVSHRPGEIAQIPAPHVIDMESEA